MNEGAAEKRKIEERMLRSFLKTDEAQLWTWKLEVELGRGCFAEDPETKDVPRYYLQTLRKRVDAVGHREHKTVLLEVKTVAGMACLGQILTYAKLYQEQEKPTGRVDLWVLTKHVDCDVHRLFVWHEITLVVV
jgi:hypothetical protein